MVEDGEEEEEGIVVYGVFIELSCDGGSKRERYMYFECGIIVGRL